MLLVSKSASKNNSPLLAVYVENISHRLLFDFQVLFRWFLIEEKNLIDVVKAMSFLLCFLPLV